MESYREASDRRFRNLSAVRIVKTGRAGGPPIVVRYYLVLAVLTPEHYSRETRT